MDKAKPATQSQNTKVSELDGCTVRIADGKVTLRRTRQFTDGHLLSAFMDGDHDAIKELCADLATRLGRDGIHDKDVSAALADIFERIGNGESPNTAFRWTTNRRGSRTKNTDYRDWVIRMTVQERMRSSGESCSQASKAVACENGGDIRLGAKMIENICTGLTLEDALPVPDGLFPLGDTRALPKPEIK